MHAGKINNVSINKINNFLLLVLLQNAVSATSCALPIIVFVLSDGDLNKILE